MSFQRFGSAADVFKKIKQSKHFNTGLPLGVLIVGCLYFISQTQSIRYEFRKQTRLDKKDFEALGIFLPDKSKTKTLEEIYEDVKDKDINQWENKRIPRPWEE